MESLLLAWICYQLCAVCAVLGMALIAARCNPRLVLGVIMAVSIAATYVFYSTPHGDVKSFIKFACEMPLGLGSLALFASLPDAYQSSSLRWFTLFVNVAVVGNIAMMVLVPDDGLMRGWTSRAACAALTVWLVRVMESDRWMTIPQATRKQSPLLLFTSCPLQWVWTHAAYRAVLVTMPAFDTPRYLLLEPMSLALMYVFAWWYRGRVVEHYFGVADTLVVATMGTLSHVADAYFGAERFRDQQEHLFADNVWEVVGCAVHVCVVLIAVVHTLKHA